MSRRAGLGQLANEYLTVPGGAGNSAGAKVSSLVAGMVAGADSIADMDLLRRGGMGRLFTGVRAPSTLRMFLRAFRFGHVRQLDAVVSRFLAVLARQAPLIGAAPLVYVDVDDTVRETYGYAKQGAGYGYTGVKGLNALLATASTKVVGAGDRGHPVAERIGRLGPRCGPAGRRRDQDHPSLQCAESARCES